MNVILHLTWIAISSSIGALLIFLGSKYFRTLDGKLVLFSLGIACQTFICWAAAEWLKADLIAFIIVVLSGTLFYKIFLKTKWAGSFSLSLLVIGIQVFSKAITRQIVSS